MRLIEILPKVRRRWRNAKRDARNQWFRLDLRVRRLAGRRPLILVQREAGIGDIISSFPALSALRARHPRALIVYITSPAFMPIVQMSGLVDRIVEPERPCEPGQAQPRDFDHYFLPQMDDERPAGERPHRPPIHLVDGFSRELGVAPVSRQPRLHVPYKAARRIEARLRGLERAEGPLVGIQVGPSWDVRMWPMEHWDALAARLQRELGATVLQLGADFHAETGAAKSDRVAGAVDWVGQLTLEETAAALARCDLFVGIDSGLLHMAGAVGTPCVGLFGPIDPALRLPPETTSLAVVADIPCLGCHHRSPVLHWKSGCPHDIRCMNELAPQAAFEACLSLLGRETSARMDAIVAGIAS